MNILEFSNMLRDNTGCEVRGFQSFAERPEEKLKMESILAENGSLIDTDAFIAGDLKPAGLVVAYLNHENEQMALYEMNEEVSANWRQRVATA